MTDGSAGRPRDRAIEGAEKALYADIDPDRKFKRIVTTDKRRAARQTKLRQIRNIDVSTGKGAIADQQFDGLIDRAMGGIEGTCMVVFGRTGAGKTHILKKLYQHPDLRTRETEEGTIRPVVKLVAPAPCTLRALGLAILSRLGYRPRKRLKENEVWDRVEANLRAQGVCVLMIDEMHNVIARKNINERESIAMTLKSLMVSEDNPIQLVLSGLDKLKTFVGEFEELERRANYIEIAPLNLIKDRKKVVNFLSGLEQRLGMPTCGFTQHDMPHRFHVASRGHVGRMAYFAQEAATIALSLGHDVVDEEVLAEAYKRPYRVADAANPFRVPDISRLSIPTSEEAVESDDETYLKGTRPKQMSLDRE